MRKRSRLDDHQTCSSQSNHQHIGIVDVHPQLIAMNTELIESIYSFLVKNGQTATAKSLVKEAKLDEKKMKKSTAKDLLEIYTASAPSK